MTPPKIPPYLLPRPPMPTDTATLQQFDAVLHEALANGGPVEGELAGMPAINYRLAAPKWQFLCHIADRCGVVLHGSGDPDIVWFEPRKSNDVNEFGDRKAVYAASDGLWPMYFAILDRQRFQMTLINSASRIEMGGGVLSDPCYFFSISAPALAQRPFRRGTIYILDRAGFEQQPPMHYGGHNIHIPQWASSERAQPLAKLCVGPEDFPLLTQMRGHDDETTFAKARANPGGFPWVD